MKQSLQEVGLNELVRVGGRSDVPAKIDTGAYSSAIWASNISVDKDGELNFSLFGEGSEFYDGKIHKTRNFEAIRVRSSNGGSEIRFKTRISIEVAGRKIRALFSLADRSSQQHPVLIGRRTLRNKFVVNVAKVAHHYKIEGAKNELNTELKQDPYAFYQKYIGDKK